jgi:hypothetical protein
LICASFAARAAAKMVRQPAVLSIGGLIEYVFDAGGMDYLYEAAMDDPEVGGQASGGLHLERWQGQGLGHQPLVGGRCISRGRLILVLADCVDLRVPVASSASF